MRAVSGYSCTEFVELLYEGKLGANVHWEPQFHLLGPAGNILHVEKLSEDFESMCKKLGKTTGRLPRLNTRRSQESTDYYTDETADIVRHLYAGDFERFGFSTEVPDTF